MCIKRGRSCVTVVFTLFGIFQTCQRVIHTKNGGFLPFSNFHPQIKDIWKYPTETRSCHISLLEGDGGGEWDGEDTRHFCNICYEN